MMTVNVLLDQEIELEQVSGTAELITQSRFKKLWVRQFIESPVNRTGFLGLLQSVGNFVVKFVRVKEKQERTLNLQVCQVCTFLVLWVIKMFVWWIKKVEKWERATRIFVKRK